MFALACLLPLGAALAAPPARGPVVVSDPKHRFEITFPAAARSISVPALTPMGLRTRTSWSADGDGGKVHYDVSTTDFPIGTKLDTSGFDEMSGVAAMFSDTGYPKSPTVCGWPARETRVQVPLASHLWQRAVFAGDCLVQIVVMRDSGPFTRADEQVVDSLKLVDLWSAAGTPAAAFHVGMPAEVTPTTTSVPLPTGSAKLTSWETRRASGELDYVVNLTEYPANMKFDVDRALQGAADGMFTTLPHDVTSRRPMALSGTPGLELRGTIRDHGTFAFRLYFRAPYLYQVGVLAAPGVSTGPREEAFLASLRLDPLR